MKWYLKATWHKLPKQPWTISTHEVAYPRIAGQICEIKRWEGKRYSFVRRNPVVIPQGLSYVCHAKTLAEILEELEKDVAACT